MLGFTRQGTDAARNAVGLSPETLCFSAGIRLTTALLCTMLLLLDEGRLSAQQIAVLLGYCGWAGWLMALETTERASGHGPWPQWLDVLWSLLALHLFPNGTQMLILTLVHPVVLTTIGQGAMRGVAVALAAAAALFADHSGELARALQPGEHRALPAFLVLAMVPAGALLARPMNLLRQRLALVENVEARLDPRRGLDAICIELVEALRAGTRADVVALVLPNALGAPAAFATRDDGSFRAKADVHAAMEALLAQAPPCALSHVVRRAWDPRPRTRLRTKLAMPRAAAGALTELATLIGVRSLHLVPLTRYARRHGHFLIGYAGHGPSRQDLVALSAAAPELLRVIEQAMLVDQLQDESAGHERARIGRDLHDSAIQPYLGLKYAVECVALRMGADNPARSDIDALAELVNGEVGALRELISGLRTGTEHGDNALVPAVKRQVRRFGLLFGIDVKIDCPESLPTTRALAGALFHMINEALNNIRKHTEARRVWITLSATAETIRLVVRDDSPSVSGQRANDYRPASLSERAAELGGSVDIGHADDGVTELVIQIPH